MRAAISRFARDENGATAIEYTMIAVLMAAALVALWPAFYSDFTETWVSQGQKIKGATQ